jgi:hypothetical protein
MEFWRTCGFRLRHASMSRGIEVRGSDRTQGVPRALGSSGARRRSDCDEGLPGADIKNTGDFACLQFGVVCGRVLLLRAAARPGHTGRLSFAVTGVRRVSRADDR